MARLETRFCYPWLEADAEVCLRIIQWLLSATRRRTIDFPVDPTFIYVVSAVQTGKSVRFRLSHNFTPTGRVPRLGHFLKFFETQNVPRSLQKYLISVMSWRK